ncbi:putative inorganic polyphosphate/ATP-NAD kinase [Pirellula sp. SH-Sr6A]|uniref:NAD(+)/NADH kinase n=1 Tax=Pirellula sp. SH-Sr6A TaxID=1632865 RepID=UPI00078E6E2B|nr:NAD(+)/NADH kinase [Pirellula sp. SH-Sr6A]AMV34119.1 putative inorganic polyphosphate/ATP-NAD kinase [Pirellula sp. SH-Sr6A]
MSEHSVASWRSLGREKPRVVVLAAPNRPRVESELPKLLPCIERHAEIVAVDKAFEYDFEHCTSDLVVVLGGDGSILQSARQMKHRQKPVLGVNLGKLGFLAAIQPDKFMNVWPEIAKGHFTLTSHLMLQSDVYRGDELLHSMIGLNEASILGGPPYSMLYIDLFIDAALATTYACDGLIISTPIGSTAHNLSAGGPILRRNLQAFVICPISPHTLTMRPVVDTADRVFDLMLRVDHPTASLVVDGRVVCHLERDMKVRIARADSSFQLIGVPGHDDYQALRDKLGWSGKPRLAE